MVLDEETINEYSKKSVDDLLDDLSFTLFYESLPNDVLPQPYYPNIRKTGEDLLRAVQKELYDHFCNREEKRPKDWVVKILNGDYKEIIIAIVNTIASSYGLNTTIALPVSVLIAKNNLRNFCSTLPNNEPTKSVKEILFEVFKRDWHLSGVLYKSDK